MNSDYIIQTLCFSWAWRNDLCMFSLPNIFFLPVLLGKVEITYVQTDHDNTRSGNGHESINFIDGKYFRSWSLVCMLRDSKILPGMFL